MYHNVMELVRAVLHLKNELCQLPPEAYVMVVKVSTGQVEAAHASPGRKREGLSFLVCPAGAFPRKTPIEQGCLREFSPR